MSSRRVRRYTARIASPLTGAWQGDDEYGHPQYDTRRTELGELLYRLKYGNDKSVINMIVSTASDFIRSKGWQIDVVVPVPSARHRSFQPVIVLAETLAQNLGVPFSVGAIKKVKNVPELKNIYGYDERIKLLSDAFRVDVHEVRDKSVLLFDDLYRSGATMNAVCSELANTGNVAKIVTLSLTMTRSNR